MTAERRAAQKHQRAYIIWLTGLSGAGKSTIANALEAALVEREKHTYLLDGDHVRNSLNSDLGFDVLSRNENVRRVAQVAKQFVEAGLIALVALISPLRQQREFARSLVTAHEFIEVHISTPLSECERRDPKGLYKRARAGEIKEFTGIDSPYESPELPEITIDTTGKTSEECVAKILNYLAAGRYL